MATLKQRLHRKNSSGTYDVIHLETDADCITGTLAVSHGGTGATTAANARTSLGITPANIGAAASSHNHSAANITSGTLSVSRGGTGRSTLTSGYFLRGNGTSAVTMSSIDQVKTALGIDELKTSVSEGKALIAAAVTDKGVQTAADDTFQQMATNISNIPARMIGFIKNIILVGELTLPYYASVTAHNISSEVNSAGIIPKYGDFCFAYPKDPYTYFVTHKRSILINTVSAYETTAGSDTVLFWQGMVGSQSRSYSYPFISVTVGMPSSTYPDDTFYMYYCVSDY